MSTQAPLRTLAPGQTCEVWTVRVEDGRRERVFVSSSILLEAPNWTIDGSALILNGDGLLWRLDMTSGQIGIIPIDGVPPLNNDHVLSPNGTEVYISANDWHIYRAPLGGGNATRLTGSSGIDSLMHFAHGVDVRNQRLAFTGLQPDGQDWWAKADVFTMSVEGNDYQRLTNGPGPADGSEFSPDGEWIYFNTEAFDGHAQIARMRCDGSHLTQLTFDEYVNWFPHLSPDGAYALYIAYPPATKGHPANCWVDLKVIEGANWQSPVSSIRVFGGQGTVNVNSWSPDGASFSYVSYPIKGQDEGLVSP